jgi:hypothetical protein
VSAASDALARLYGAAESLDSLWGGDRGKTAADVALVAADLLTEAEARELLLWDEALEGELGAGEGNTDHPLVPKLKRIAGVA